eukprot:GILJ01004233.1.p1 GENE.GILJ01004233.1~~GILJ01004233.1.p1  ORF type:complete len:449 (+),score=35.87 GILJ01004233.1:76-1347(+)
MAEPLMPPHNEAMDKNSSASERLCSLDGMRGLTIAVMILVDNIGGDYPSVGHIYWNGFHFADFVFPFFLFMVGVSMALAFKKFSSSGNGSKLLLQRAVVRTAKLFALGFMIQGGAFPYYDLSTFRYCGILQRIAFAYLVITLMELYLPQRRNIMPGGRMYLFKRYVWHWVTAGVILFTYCMLTYVTDVPGCGRGQVTIECNAHRYWDEQILGYDHMYGDPTYSNSPECSVPARPSWCALKYDPEGIVSTFTAVLSTFIGMHFGHALIHFKAHQDRLQQWAPVSVLMFSLGIILHFSDALPLNKNLYSVSYLLFMGGSAGLCLMLFYYVVDIRQIQTPFLPFVWLGMNAIFIFVFSDSGGIASAVIKFVYYKTPDRNFLSWVQDTFFFSWMSHGPGTVIYTLIGIGFWMMVARYLHKKKWYWKV